MIRRLRRAAGAALDRRVARITRDIAELRPALHPLHDGIERTEQRLDAIAGDLALLREHLDVRLDGTDARADLLGDRLDQHAGRLDRLQTTLDDDVSPLLLALAAEEAGNRRRLARARAEPGYEDPFAEPDPLVTITIPTRGRPEALRDRSLPSLLAQTHANIEVIVVGDMAGEETAAAVAAMADERVRFHDTTHRVIHPDSERHWLAAATLPRNEGYRLARGLWTLDFDDDDALRPDAVERLLAHARETRAEVVHGAFAEHGPDGTVTPRGEGPPARDDFSLAAALVHRSLLIFERQHFAADLGLPGDWFRAWRMLRAGARFARVDAVVMDYYPTWLWGRGGAGATPGS